MDVDVIGAGLFGCVASIVLAQAGHRVTLYDRAGDIMQAASASSQARLHRGYHYPRAPSTGQECRSGNASFYAMFPSAVITPWCPAGKQGQSLYAIARKGSHTTGPEFDSFCRRHDLPARIVAARRPVLDPATISMAWSVLESRLDIPRLTALIRVHLNELSIDLRLSTEGGRPPSAALAPPLILATYTAPKNQKNQKYNHQLVEKPVIELPSKWRNQSVVVMDGPFGCVDPYGLSGLHVLGSVRESLHWEGEDRDQCPVHLSPFLNNGIVDMGQNSKFVSMRDRVGEFCPFVLDAVYKGSFLTHRAVIHDPETDARPTLVTEEGPGVLRIFSGKMGTCVDAANEVLRRVEAM